MTKIIIKLLTLLILAVTTNIKAQDFQGKAYYQTKRIVDMKIDTGDENGNDEMQKQIQEMLKKQFEKTYILTFNKTESIYKEEDQLEKPQGNAGMMIVIGNSSDILYKNTKDKTYVKGQEDFGKKFIIKDEIEPLKWEMTKETKMIGKYLCIKAVAIKMIDDYEDTDELKLGEMPKKKDKQKELKIVAWYTPEIPVSNGPEFFGGLPGLIMELHEDKMHYVCSKIVLNPSDKVEIAAPKKGKVMNQKDFDEMMEKKYKEMMENFKSGRKKGDDGNTIMFSIGG